jgi:ssDNA-binding Zn-finger/Zn-ribbon topoisomerase 1
VGKIGLLRFAGKRKMIADFCQRPKMHASIETTPGMMNLSTTRADAISKQKKKLGIRCPACQSDVHYKYGRTKSGKKRYLCLICGRQFVRNSAWKTVVERPDCPTCGQPMHVYMRHRNYIRFRCAQYPECRTFVKIDQEDDELHE